MPEKSENTDKWIRRVLYWGRTDGQTELEDDEYVEPEMIKKNNNDVEPDWSTWMNIEHGYAFIQGEFLFYYSKSVYELTLSIYCLCSSPL